MGARSSSRAAVTPDLSSCGVSCLGMLVECQAEDRVPEGNPCADACAVLYTQAQSGRNSDITYPVRHVVIFEGLHVGINQRLSLPFALLDNEITLPIVF